jgi:protein translocase SecG subunit
MKNLIPIIQIITAILLILTILVQTKGTGFGRVWGSTGSSFTRRGLEKLVFRATFAFATIFIVISILQFII